MCLDFFNSIEDAIVWGKVLVVLGELGLLPQDPVAWNYGRHRLYQVMVTTSHENPFHLMEQKFCDRLDRLNIGGTVNPQLYSADDYVHLGFTRTFLIVYI